MSTPSPESAPPTIGHADGASKQIVQHPAPLRLGCVSYLNTLPLIEGLAKLRSLRLTLTAPARLIDLLLGGDIDAGLVSIIDHHLAPARPGSSASPLVLLPVGMIGCDGPTMTVRLVSRLPLEQIAEIHADIDSHTSIALLRIILAERCGTHPRLIDFDAESHRALREAARASGKPEPWPDALLVIGDKVVTDSPPASLYPHQLDLGEAWLKLTGLPFVYAAWMCRTQDASDARIQTLCSVLDRQRRHNGTRLEWIVRHRAPQRGWPTDAARHYLSHLIRYEVTPEHREGVERFFDLARTHGIVRSRRELLWRDA